MPRRWRFVAGAAGALGWMVAAVGSAGAMPTITFEPAATTELTGADPRGAVAGDFDEDGHLDVAVTQWAGDSDDSVGILFGNGAGGFHDNGNFGGIPYSQGVGAADFDEDGHLDLVVTQGTQTKFASDPVCGAAIGTIVAFGAGDGSFAPAVCLVGGSFPIDVAIDDFNGDDHADVAVANNVSHGITTFLGTGDGTFAAGADIPVAYWTNYTDVVAADFDEDGVPDLAASHYNGAYVFRGNGDGTFAAVGGAGSSWLLEAVAAGDLNGDTHVDLAFTEIYNDRLLLCPGAGDGTFGACETRTVGGFMREVGIADLNRDGFGDAAVSWQSGNQVRVFLGTGGGAFDAGTSFAAGLQPTPMVFVDLNEDGWLDVAEANRNLGDQAYLSVLIQIPQALGCTDTDGDGYAVEGGACGPVDCDDADAAVNPGAAEVPGNGVDDDCDGAVDETPPGGCAPVRTERSPLGFLWTAAGALALGVPAIRRRGGIIR